MKKRVLVIGSYGAGNLGDEAILEQIVASHGENHLIVCSGNPTQTKLKHEVEAISPMPFGLKSLFRCDLFQTILAFRSADIVLFGGGGLLQDEDFWACPIWAWQFFWAKKIFRKPVFLYTNSVGPLRTNLGRTLARFVLKNADFITVRDEASRALCESFGVDAEVTADPVFGMEYSMKKRERRRRVAISLRPYDADLSVFQHVDFGDAELLGIAMEEADRQLLEKIPNIRIISPKSSAELLEILSQCDGAIGMRLHFIIFAALARVPKILPIAYGSKVAALSNLLGLSSVEAKKLSLERFSAAWNGAKGVSEEALEAQKRGAARTKELFESFLKEKG